MFESSFDYDLIFKIYESAVLKLKFLYSTVLERKLEEKDFEIMIDENNHKFSILNNLFMKRIYLPISHDEQKIMIANSLAVSEYNLGTLEHQLNELNDIITNMFTTIETVTDEHEFEHISVMLITKAFNVTLSYVVKSIENIPAELFKTSMLNLFAPLSTDEMTCLMNTLKI